MKVTIWRENTHTGRKKTRNQEYDEHFKIKQQLKWKYSKLKLPFDSRSFYLFFSLLSKYIKQIKYVKKIDVCQDEHVKDPAGKANRLIS